MGYRVIFYSKDICGELGLKRIPEDATILDRQPVSKIIDVYTGSAVFSLMEPPSRYEQIRKPFEEAITKRMVEIGSNVAPVDNFKTTNNKRNFLGKARDLLLERENVSVTADVTYYSDKDRIHEIPGIW